MNATRTLAVHLGPDDAAHLAAIMIMEGGPGWPLDEAAAVRLALREAADRRRAGSALTAFTRSPPPPQRDKP